MPPQSWEKSTSKDIKRDDQKQNVVQARRISESPRTNSICPSKEDQNSGEGGDGVAK